MGGRSLFGCGTAAVGPIIVVFSNWLQQRFEVMVFFDRKKAAVDTGDKPKGGFLARFKRGLQKTRQLLDTDVRDLFKQGDRVVDAAFLSELFAILIKTDMGANVLGHNSY